MHTVVVSASDVQSSFAASIYEKCLLAVAKSLWYKLPSSDKVFSREMTSCLATQSPHQGRTFERIHLMKEGFSTWNRKDFSAFIKAVEKYGRSDPTGIASEMEGKAVDEVERYLATFNERFKELSDYEQIICNIERGEAAVALKKKKMRIIVKKMNQYKKPFLELQVPYGQSKGKGYSEELDLYMLCMVPKIGLSHYGL